MIRYFGVLILKKISFIVLVAIGLLSIIGSQNLDCEESEFTLGLFGGVGYNL
jgi:hypothetical protein